MDEIQIRFEKSNEQPNFGQHLFTISFFPSLYFGYNKFLA